MDITLQEVSGALFYVAMGIGLSACSGLRAFLPLLVVGVAGRLDWVPLSEKFAWLEGTPALTVFGCAVLFEILADKVPMIDHMLDMVETLVKPIAGALVMATVVSDWAPLPWAVVWIITGGALSGLVHVTKAKLRVLSSATTLGAANPAISAGEDVTVAVASVGSIFLPVLVAIPILVGIGLVWFGFLRVRRRLA